MIAKLSRIIADFFIRQKIIPEEQREIYEYGFELSISSVIRIVIVLAIGLISGKFWESGVCHLVCLILLRSFCGGYHAGSYFKCNSLMVIFFALSYFVGELLVYFNLTGFQPMSILLMLAFLPIYAFAPVKNKHKPLSESKAKKCRIPLVPKSGIFYCKLFQLSQHSANYPNIVDKQNRKQYTEIARGKPKMIQRIALKLTNFIFKHTALDSELFEIYKYGVEITISTLLNIILIISAGIAVSDIISGVIFLAVFILIRSFVGGYHAKTYFMCNSVFVLTYLAVFGVNRLALLFVEGDLLTRLLTSLILLGLIPIIAFAPVKNPNKPLSDKQARLCRAIGISAYIAVSFIALILRFSGINYGSFIVITLTAVSVMILIEIIKTRRCKRND